MNEQMELKIKRELELKEFELRSISEAEEKSKEIAEEIKGKIGNCEKSERKCRAKAEEYK